MLLRQQVQANQFGLAVLVVERRESHYRESFVCPKGNMTSHTFEGNSIHYDSIYLMSAMFKVQAGRKRDLKMGKQ